MASPSRVLRLKDWATLLYKSIFSFCVGEIYLHVCMCVQHMRVWCLQDPKRTSDPLELGLQTGLHYEGILRVWFMMSTFHLSTWKVKVGDP